jgi:hypothetical protein
MTKSVTWNIQNHKPYYLPWIKLPSMIRVMVFSATFNNISVILWRSVSLVEETGLPGKKHRPVASH